MKAIILAAGLSSRMGQLPKQKPKCLLEINNIPIIKQQILSLKANNINDINVIVGYKKDMVKRAIKELGLTYYSDPEYKKTGMLEDIFAAKEKLNGEFILIYGDVFFKPSVIEKLLQDKNDFCMVVDKLKHVAFEEEITFETRYGQKIRKGSSKVKIIGTIVKNISKSLTPDEANAEYIGIMKFSKRGTQLLYNRIKYLIESKEIKKFPSPSYLIKWFIDRGEKVHAVFIDKSEYAEIDYKKDLDEAEKRFQTKVKGIIFDAEDVIYYRDKEALMPIINFLKSKNPNITIEQFKKAYEKDQLKLYKRKALSDKYLNLRRTLNYLNISENENFFKEFIKVFEKNYSNIKINKETGPLFKKFKNKNLKIGILTDTFSSAKRKREDLKAMDLEQFVDAIVCSSETGYTKDQKESYDAMLKKLNLKSDEVIFVGHKEYEMQGARKANIRSISIVKGIEEDIYINNLSKLIDLI